MGTANCEVEDSEIWGYDGASLGRRFLAFRGTTVPSSLSVVIRGPLTQRNAVTWQTTEILRYTDAKTEQYRSCRYH